MKTLQESILDVGFDIEEDKEIFMALNSVEWKPYDLRIFRTEERSIYDILEKYITKSIDKKISINKAFTTTTNPSAMSTKADGQCILIFGEEQRGFKTLKNDFKTIEEWDYIQITTPEYCIRIKKYIYSIYGRGKYIVISILNSNRDSDKWKVKKTSIKKAFTLSNGDAVVKAFTNFYEKYIG